MLNKLLSFVREQRLLAPGDRVSIVEETGRGYFVKHNGVSGWYFGALEKDKNDGND